MLRILPVGVAHAVAHVMIAAGIAMAGSTYTPVADSAFRFSGWGTRKAGLRCRFGIDCSDLRTARIMLEVENCRDTVVSAPGLVDRFWLHVDPYLPTVQFYNHDLHWRYDTSCYSGAPRTRDMSLLSPGDTLRAVASIPEQLFLASKEYTIHLSIREAERQFVRLPRPPNLPRCFLAAPMVMKPQSGYPFTDGEVIGYLDNPVPKYRQDHWRDTLSSAEIKIWIPGREPDEFTETELVGLAQGRGFPRRFATKLLAERGAAGARFLVNALPDTNPDQARAIFSVLERMPRKETAELLSRHYYSLPRQHRALAGKILLSEPRAAYTMLYADLLACDEHHVVHAALCRLVELNAVESLEAIQRLASETSSWKSYQGAIIAMQKLKGTVPADSIFTPLYEYLSASAPSPETKTSAMDCAAHYEDLLCPHILGWYLRYTNPTKRVLDKDYAQTSLRICDLLRAQRAALDIHVQRLFTSTDRRYYTYNAAVLVLEVGMKARPEWGTEHFWSRAKEKWKWLRGLANQAD